MHEFAHGGEYRSIATKRHDVVNLRVLIRKLGDVLEILVERSTYPVLHKSLDLVLLQESEHLAQVILDVRVMRLDCYED